MVRNDGASVQAVQRRPGRYLSLEVEDDGCGMDDETVQRIFDPFFTSKIGGLGLAAVLGLARSHRGGLRVESKVGVGTRFTVFFPASELPASTTASREPRKIRGSGTVLVVDDGAAVRRLARRSLARLGFEIVEADDGRKALEVLRANGPSIRLVLLDMNMPNLGGVDTLRALRELDRDLPVILSSGYDDRDLSSEVRSDAPVAFLKKPYSPADLADCLASLGVCDEEP